MNATSIYISILCSFLCLTSCEAQNSGDALAQNTITSKTSSTSTTNQKSFVNGKDYVEFVRSRVIDRTGFAQPVEAASFLIPKGWKLEGDIIWSLPGQGCEGTNQVITISSDDGNIQIRFNPIYTWTWSSDQTMNQMSMQTAKQGTNCIIGQPMNAEMFVRNAVIPQLPSGTQLVKMDPNAAVSDELKVKAQNALNELRNYGASDIKAYFSAVNAYVKFPDGHLGLMMVGMTNSEIILPNPYNGTYTTQYGGTLNNYITMKYPAQQEEQAKNILAVILGSMKVNPDWSNTVNQFWKDFRAKRQVAHVGRIRLMDQQTQAMAAQHQKNMQAKSQAFQQNVRSWETTQQTNDKINTNFIKAIREVDHFKDDNGTVELSSHYNHAWSRNDGSSYIMTNSPNFDPSSVFQDQSWQQMKKVD